MNELSTLDLPEYQNFLEQATKQISQARIRAAKSVNKESMSLYWWLGEHIALHQSDHAWGKSVVEKLSTDLRKIFPDAKFGFSPRNLWDMRRFYLEYKDHLNLRQLVAEIPWGQNLLIMNKVKNNDERQYYLTATKEQAWTRDTLSMQINSNAYERHRLADKKHNFNITLPKDLAEQADQSMKDVYMFDMLGITQPVIEAEIEHRMVEKIKDVFFS